jgi:hypothetical protein
MEGAASDAELPSTTGAARRSTRLSTALDRAKQRSTGPVFRACSPACSGRPLDACPARSGLGFGARAARWTPGRAGRKQPVERPGRKRDSEIACATRAEGGSS